MINVIIPALNEEKTIARVVRLAKNSPKVTEVIVVNICDKYGVDLKNKMVVGDGENDICMIRKAGIGVSFCSTNNYVDSLADYVIKEPDFKLLIPIIN